MNRFQMKTPVDRGQVESRFRAVYEHLSFLVAYARRRGARDPEAIASEAMAIAWRRLADVPVDDARPWLIATTRNLLLADRRRGPTAPGVGLGHAMEVAAEEAQVSPELDLNPELGVALQSLSESDREALLLVAWEDLTPTMAAASLGITPTAFRMRLHRARQRLTDRLTYPRPRSRNLPCSPQTDWRQP
jgi:RNA polymerase sigma-70 factor (ECF subfamily)